MRVRGWIFASGGAAALAIAVAALAPIERELLGRVVEAFAHGRVVHHPGNGRWAISS